MSYTAGNDELIVQRTGSWAVPSHAKPADRMRRMATENARLRQEVAELRLRNILLEESLAKRS